MNAHMQRFDSQLNQNLVDHDNSIVEGTHCAAQLINLIVIYYAMRVVKRIGLKSSSIREVAQQLRLSLSIPVLEIVGEDPHDRAARTVQVFGLAPADEIRKLISAKAPAAAATIQMRQDRRAVEHLSSLYRENKRGFEISEFFAGTPLDLMITEESEDAAKRHKLSVELTEVLVAGSYVDLLTFAEKVIGVPPAQQPRFLMELSEFISDPRRRMVIRNSVSKTARKLAIRIRAVTNVTDNTPDES